MHDDPLSSILGGLASEPGVRMVDGNVRIGVCFDGDRLVRGGEDDGPEVRIRAPLDDATVELQIWNFCPAHSVTCRVYLPSGSMFVCSSFYPLADGSAARCFVRIPARRAAGTRILVTDDTTEIWTRIV